MSDMKSTINEYTDENGKSLYAEWLGKLRDARAKAYWQDHKRRHPNGA